MSISDWKLKSIVLLHRSPEHNIQSVGHKGHQQKPDTDPRFHKQTIGSHRMHKTPTGRFEMARAEFAAAQFIITIGGTKGIAYRLRHTSKTTLGTARSLQLLNPRGYAFTILGLPHTSPQR